MHNLNNLPAAFRANFILMNVLKSDALVAFCRAEADKVAGEGAGDAAWVAAFDKAAAKWVASEEGAAYIAAAQATTDYSFLGNAATDEARRLIAA